MSDGFNKLAEGFGKAIEVVPELYQDALQPTMQEAGKLMARIPRAINAAFSGLDKWILNREYSIDETKKILAQKLENVDPDKIVEPEAYVAIPAIQAISYSMNSEELRELYANLLAKAMNSDTKDLVHPSFVEIIKQMSPIDVHVLEEISTDGFIQTVDIYCSKYSNEHNTSNHFLLKEQPIKKLGYEGLTHITQFPPEVVKVSIDNLLRLRLIEERFTIGASVNEKIKESPIYIKMVKQLKTYMIDNLWEYQESASIYVLTSFGISFRNICLGVS